MQKFLFLLFLTIQSLSLQAQVDYQWWNKKHQWDGSTHWTQYMIISPGFLGPNALPVPVLYSARIPDQHHFEFGLENHYSTGDQTINLFAEYNFPLFTDRASFQISYRPIEFYRTDTVTRDSRRSRELEPSGYSLGDLYASTYIQLIRDHSFLPDLMVSANIRTASGTRLEAARHSDTPGYWFDATLGKRIEVKSPIFKSLSFYGKIGFYAFQTFKLNHYQNDAVLYGAGITVDLVKFRVQNQLNGYHGYLDNGDSPLVYRIIFETIEEKKINYRLIFQQGLHDYDYSTFRITAILNIKS